MAKATFTVSVKDTEEFQRLAEILVTARCFLDKTIATIEGDSWEQVDTLLTIHREAVALRNLLTGKEGSQ
jgi:hypothetical protein